MVLTLLFNAIFLPVNVKAEKSVDQQKLSVKVKQKNIWDGSIANAFAGGDGTESNPYVISTAAELAYLAQEINNGNEKEGTYYKQTQDIYLNDISDFDNWENTPPSNNWTSIGKSGNPFGGHYDGQGNDIYGMYINSNDNYQGLFGYVYAYKGTCTIENLDVSGYIISQGIEVGGIVGRGAITSLALLNCSFDGKVTALGDVGGIIGFAESYTGDELIRIDDCSNKGEIVALEGSYKKNNTNYNRGCGGVVGWALASSGSIWIRRCSNFGVVNGKKEDVGGIVGEAMSGLSALWSNIVIQECYNTGTVYDDTILGAGIAGVLDRQFDQNISVDNCYDIGNRYFVRNQDDVEISNSYFISNVENAKFSNNNKYDKNCYSSVSEDVVNYLSSAEFKDINKFGGFDFDNIWSISAVLGRPVLRNNMEEANSQGTGNYSKIIEAVKKYSTDNETLKKMILAISEKDLPYDIKMQLMSSVCIQYGFDDVQEGIDYVQDASSAQRAYQTLINNEQYGCWQFGYYLNNTTKGKVARGLLYANGLIFNDELGDWLDPGTYVDSEFPGIKKYKTLLSKFIQDNANDFEVYSKASEVVSIVNDMKKIKDIDDDSVIDVTLDKLFEASPEEQDELINQVFKDNLLVLTETDTETGNDISYIMTKDEAFCKAFGISSKTFKVITDGTKDILEFINFSTKMKLYEEYTDFFNEIIGAEDLPFELRAAASELKMEMESGYLKPIKELLLHGLKNGCELSDEIDKVTEDKVTIEKGELSNFLGEAIETIKIGAFFANLLVDMGGVVKNAAYTNGYAYLTAHYANVLEESRIEFNKNQTEENAWDFYTKYNMLYKLRIEGEKSYLELNELSPDGIMGWGGFLLKYAFDYSSKKDLVEYNTNYLENNCKFQLPENIAVPEHCKYAQKTVVNCPVDVEIINSEGVSIAKIMDGEESDITNSYGRFISQYKPYTSDYTKIIYLKDDGQYEYKIIGKNDGDVSLKMTSQDGTISGFNNVNIHKDDVIFAKSQNSDTYDIDFADDGTIDETYELDKEKDDSIVLLKSLQISDEILELEVGEKHSLRYTYEPLNSYNNQVSWEVIDNNIVSISEAGEVLAKEVGTTDIYCISTSRDNNDDLILKKCTVSVKKEQPSETAEPSETEAPSGTSKPSRTETPSETPKPSETLKPSGTKVPSGTPKPSKTSKPSGTKVPSGTPKPSGTKAPGGITEPNGTSNPANSSSLNKWSTATGKCFTDSSKNAVYKITKLGTTNTVEYVTCKKKNAKNVSVPSIVRYKAKVYKVTSIGKNAFAKNKKLQKIDLGKNISLIKNKAFYKCKKLSVVKFNSKLKIIGKQAFQGCSNITVLTLPKNLKKIGDRSFYGCSKLQYIMIKSKKLTNSGIGTLSFAKCNKKIKVKTANSKWRLYAYVMITKGKISSKATFVVNSTPLIQ